MIEASQPEIERKSWIEPEIRSLEIEETFFSDGAGVDGGDVPDCTRS